jgi:hypothetical protein
MASLMYDKPFVAEACDIAARQWDFPTIRGRLHGAFFMCVSMSDKPFDAEACDIGGQACATNGLSDMKTHRVIDPIRKRDINVGPFVVHSSHYYSLDFKTQPA